MVAMEYVLVWTDRVLLPVINADRLVPYKILFVSLKGKQYF